MQNKLATKGRKVGRERVVETKGEGERGGWIGIQGRERGEGGGWVGTEGRERGRKEGRNDLSNRSLVRWWSLSILT